MTSPIRSRTRLNRSPSASTSATRSPGGELMGDVEAKAAKPRKTGGPNLTSTGPAPIDHTAPGTSPARQASRGQRPPPRKRTVVDHGDLDMRIARDGTWYYRGSPIARQRLVKLFASVLRREDDGNFWVFFPRAAGGGGAVGCA